MLRVLGFDTDYVFIRSGQFFSFGAHGRTSIMISEIHRFQECDRERASEREREREHAGERERERESWKDREAIILCCRVG
jgi:hypothetical protein